jgi:hypothetical protein
MGTRAKEPAKPRQAQLLNGKCRICGCTDDRGCPAGCCWADTQCTLCSVCALAIEVLKDYRENCLTFSGASIARLAREVSS